VLIQFEESGKKDDQIVKDGDFEFYTENWSKYDADGAGRISSLDLQPLMASMPPPLGTLGVERTNQSKLAWKMLAGNVRHLHLPDGSILEPDRFDMYYFHDVLFALCHKAASRPLPNDMVVVKLSQWKMEAALNRHRERAQPKS